MSFRTRGGWFVGVLSAVLVFVGDSRCLGLEAVERARQERATFHGRVFLVEGKIELEKGNYLRAIRLLTEAMQRGADVEAIKLRGKAYALSGTSDKAIADYTLFINHRPADPAGYLLRAETYLLTQQYKQCAEDCAAALRIDPENPASYVIRGLASAAQENYREAIVDFEKALHIAPHHQAALLNLAIVHALCGRSATARTLFTRAQGQETDPGWLRTIETWLSQLPPGPDIAPEEPLYPFDQSETSLQKMRTTTDPPLGSELTRTLEKKEKASVASSHSTVQPRLVARQGNLNGTWETTYLGSKIHFQIQQQGIDISGVLRITNPRGKEDVYHFTGTLENGMVKASHHSGHSFQGRIRDDNQLEGVLTTREGKTFPITLAR